MHYRKLGNTNLEISEISLGLMGMGSQQWREWVLEKNESFAILSRAKEMGVNFFDTSNFYSLGESETLLGDYFNEAGCRDKIVIATKFGNRRNTDPNMGGYSKKHIISAVEGSLRRLRTDYIDLLQTHIWEPDSNIEEVLEAFEMLKAQGKIIYAGFTNVPMWQLALAERNDASQKTSRWDSVQVEYNYLRADSEDNLMPFCKAIGKGVLAYGPIARGYLAGSTETRTTNRALTDEYLHQWYVSKEDERRRKIIISLAKEYNWSAAQLSLAWALGNRDISSVLVGVANPDQLIDLLAIEPDKYEGIRDLIASEK
tara:strand:- start:991 stop:1932 length:942 start_codon:yes stop_codon:yes gene_type:complete